MDGVDHSKRSMHPKKFFDGWKMVTHVHVPRKLRSAIKKRTGAPNSSPFSGNLKLKKAEKKPKLNLVEETDKEVLGSKITQDEQEVAEALFALAGLAASSMRSFNAQGFKPSSNAEETVEFQTPSDDQLHIYVPLDLNLDNNAGADDGSKLYGKNNTLVDQRTQTLKPIVEKDAWKRSCTHVHISRLVKVLQRSNVSNKFLQPPLEPALSPRQQELQSWPPHFLPTPYRVVAASHMLEWQSVGQNGHSRHTQNDKIDPRYYSFDTLQLQGSATMGRGQYRHFPESGFAGSVLPPDGGTQALQMLSNGHH